MQSNFEWDDAKNRANIKKHKISFDEAQYAFLDEQRIIAVDINHSSDVEKRYYCFGKTEKGIVTVRFIFRNSMIRIIGAGYWRKGKNEYEKKNNI
ncbi:MAG TPA: hypothetical protein DCQ28_13910 [Bacteroidetes bacterium]|nr:hypothetical protein [Bacteroidota bacterium]